MQPDDIPFDVSYYFDDNLHDTPNAPEEMRQAVALAQARVANDSHDQRERIRLLGLIGVYARMLRDFATAQTALTDAVALSDQLGDERLRVVNVIRLAHVYQWRQEFMTSEQLFAEAVACCKANSELAGYLDFAYQHLGKCKFDQARYDAAEQAFTQALDLRLRKGDQALIESTQLALDVTRRRARTGVRDQGSGARNG